jgi:spermidine/putrescine transport system permease protein
MTQTKVELEGSSVAPSRSGRSSKPRRGRSFKPRYPAWLVLPSMVYYLIFFIGAMAILVAFSLATQTGFGQISYGVSFAQFKNVLDSLYLNIFARTMLMAFLGTALTIAVGYPVAYWMARYLSTYKMLALLLIVVPFWTSFLIRTYALKIILDPQGYLATDLHIDIMYTKYAVGVASSTTICRCSSCPCSRRWSAWTGPSSRRRPIWGRRRSEPSGRSPCRSPCPVS